MYRVKICGVTSVDDARVVAESGADAIGINFFNKSKRYVTMDAARKIANEVRGKLILVGVFVNESTDRMVDIADQLAIGVNCRHGPSGASHN